MPKRIKTINQFHGGLNTFADPRDAAENTLTEANDLMVDEIGKIRVFGKHADVTNGLIPKGSADTVAGYGLFNFSHDYPGLGSTYTSGKGLKDVTALSTNYTILSSADSSNQKFHIFGHPQAEDVGTELILLQANRDFTGTANWQTGSSYGTAFGTGSSTINQSGDLSLNTGNLSVVCSAYLSTAKAPMSIGVSYRLTFDVANIVGTWTIKDAGSNTITTISTNGSKDIQFVSQGSGGIVFLSPASQNSTIDLDNFSLKEGSWSQNFSLGSNGNFRMLPYNVDGQLRVTESNFSNSSTPKWFGYLVRDYMDGEKYDGWYTEDATYTKPSRSTDTSGANSQSGKFSYHNSSSTNGLSHTVAAGGIHIMLLQKVQGTGSWKFATGDETYKFYVSYIYDGGYDSQLELLADTDDNLTGLDTNDKILRVYVKINSTDTDSDSDWFTHHSPRIIGFRLYYTKIKEISGVSSPYMITEHYFDASKGGRIPLSSAWTPWKTQAGTQQTDMQIDAPPTTLSYEDINGYSHEETVSAQFKTICILNRKAYIGNIKQDGIVHGDMMIKSPVNGFDLFPKSRSIEVSVHDGDDIIKLEEYADRILQFKKNKMHLINVSQEIEFLEDTFMHKGIDYPTASCKTDFGIAWVNKHGCYLYNGKSVSNLLEKQGRKMISDSDWQSHLNNHVAISYLARNRQLIIVNSLSTSGTKNVYLYDLVTGSWVKSTAAMWSSNSKALSNIVTDYNGDLIWSYKESGNSKFLKWDNSSGGPDNENRANFELKTKSMSFGNPAQRKNIYKVYVTYRGAGSGITVTYGVDGDETPTEGFTSGSLGDVSTDKWTVKPLIPSTSIVNVDTFRLKFAGTAGSTFEINDISVVYRLKSVK